MARARNIKPGVMDNEQLAAQPFGNRLLFVYLWMLADREGRLEDRPARIAAQALPYDRSFDVAGALHELAACGFIRRYVVAGHAVIQIQNFAKHQSPHGTERDSALPDEAGMRVVHTRSANGYATGEKTLVPCACEENNQSKSTTWDEQQKVNGALTVNQQSNNTLIHRFTDSPIHSVSNETGASADAALPADTEGGASDDQASEQQPMTAKERAWSVGVAVLGASSRAFIGKLVATYGEEAVAAVMEECARVEPGEPKSWVSAACAKRKEGPKSGRGEAFDPLSNPTPSWATKAGFANRFEAENAGCFERNHAQFKDGERVGVAA